METLVFVPGPTLIPVRTPCTASPRHSISLPLQDPGEMSGGSSPRVSIRRRKMCRSYSEPSLSGSHNRSIITLTKTPEDRKDSGKWPSTEEPELPGGRGQNNHRNPSGGGGRRRNGRNDGGDLGTHYRRLLQENPANPLILRNYGKYLHEVEKDAVKAEECYGRAILASPGDGELLCLYGRLIWETQGDGTRAMHYFSRAVGASPDDSTVLGSYARFLWEAGEEEWAVEAF